MADNGIEIFYFGTGINQKCFLRSFHQIHGGFVGCFQNPHVVFKPRGGNGGVLNVLACRDTTASPTEKQENKRITSVHKFPSIIYVNLLCTPTWKMVHQPCGGRSPCNRRTEFMIPTKLLNTKTLLTMLNRCWQIWSACPEGSTLGKRLVRRKLFLLLQFDWHILLPDISLRNQPMLLPDQ